jgi:photosystem II stability/assembly factor-like uncharacterized protein
MRKAILTAMFAILLATCLFVVNYRYKTHSTQIAKVTPVRLFDADREENEQDGIRERLEQEITMTQDPALGYVPTDRLAVAEKTAARLAKLSKVEDMQALTWTERGPNNLGGRSRAILIDKSDATGNTVFIGSVGGGLWRTTNFKAATPTWNQIASVSANLAITTLAQNPTTPTIMYAGTGEGYFNTDAIRGLGIYKSTDGGLTWSLLASTTTGGTNEFDFSFVQKILVYTNGDVYASGISAVFCNAGGILKSTNGGTSWTRVIGNLVGGVCATAFDFFGYDIEMSSGGDLWASVIDNANSFVAPATMDTTRGKVFRSPAGATVGNTGTWVNVTPPPPVAANSLWMRIELACSPTNNNKVYAIMEGTNFKVGGIRVTTDAGANWTNIDNTTLWCDQGTSTSTDFSRSQAWYDLPIAVKPDDDQTVFVGGVDLMKTTNGGTSWVQNTQWAAGCATLPSIHADNHNIVYLPGLPNEFIVVNDGGVYYTNDNGVTYINKSPGYRTIQYYSAAIHPTAGSNYMLAGAQDNGTHKFSTAGLGSVTTATSGDGGFCFIDQGNPNFQVASFTNTNYRVSNNGGTSFAVNANFGANGRFINPTDYDNTTHILYAGYTTTNMLRINDITGVISGASINFPAATSRQVSALKVDPNTANRVFVAFSGGQGIIPQLYYVDAANTASPTINTITLPAAIGGTQFISHVDVETGNANHLLITISNYGAASIYESTDLGVTWTSLDNNGVNLPDVPVRWSMFLPSGVSGFGGRFQAVSGIMIATEIGVWTTTATSGTTTVWTQSSGMPNVRVDMLVYRASDRTVVAATHGRGLFTTVLQSALPVSVLSFDGKLDNNTALLNWTTSAEYDSKNFEIEKSTDGVNYTEIGVLAAAGNTTSQRKYSFRDLKLSAANYYRLKMNDIDGQFKLSNVVLLRYNEPKQMVSVVNTPFANDIRLKFLRPAAQAKLQLINASGMLVAEKTMNNPWGEMQWDIPAQISKGTYMLRAVVDGQLFTAKTMKQ